VARPQKQTVDYFPHDTDASDGKTLTIIQAKYGNDGYAFWFKLLQLLGKTPGHYYDFNKPADWEFLLAKTHQNDTERAKGILETLVVLDAIDAELYAHGVIWCQKFVDRVADAYDRTVNGPPQRPAFLVNVGKSEVSVSDEGVSADKNPEKPTVMPQTKLKETKLNKSKEKRESTSQKFEVFWKAYPKRKSKGQAEKAFVKLNPDEQLLAAMLATIERAKKSVDWLKDDGKFIPYPATWLNAKGWEDEFPEKGGSSGAHRQGSGKLIRRDQYTKPPPNPKLDKLVEQERAAKEGPGRDESG